MRNILIVIACVLQVAFLTGAGAFADDSELHRKNRELVAKDYELKESLLTAARIGQRRPKVECTGLCRFFGYCREPNEIEIVGHLKSGEQLVIDRVVTSGALSGPIIGVRPTIIDRAGDTVGYFHSTLNLDVTWPSHRVAFVIYLVGQKGLIRREGEATCKKIPSEGYPTIGVSNAQFDVELRELEFTLRSSCYHVDLFGAGPRRTLNMLRGDFSFDANLKEHRGVDLAQRVRVSFDASGDTFTFTVAKGDAESRRAFRRCVENAKTAPGFHTCTDGTTRSRAFWRFGTEQVSFGFCESGSDVTGDAYFVRACLSNGDATKRWVNFDIASENAPRGIVADIECSCGRLEVDRLSFDPQHRTLSFNLDTDAKVIKFAGGEFQVPTIASRTVGGRMSMEIPVFTIRFNEHWQIVEMTAAAGDTTSGR